MNDRKKTPRSTRTGKFYVGMGMAVLVGLTSAACGSSSSPSEGSKTGAASDSAAAKLLPSDIRSAGKIKIASTISYPPEQFYKADGKTATGFSVDIGNALGKQLGVKFVFNNVNFDAVIPGIAAGRFDAAISSITITPERNAQVNFVSYLNSGGTLLVKAANPKNITGIDSLCGNTIAAVKGSTWGDSLEVLSKKCVDDGKSKIKITTYESGGQLQAVSSGRADALYGDFTGNAYAAKNSNGQLKSVGEISQRAPYGIAVSKKDLPLANAIKKAMNSIIKSGEYVKILKKWNVDQGALTTSEVIK